MRIVFMGTPESALYVLQRLVESARHDVVAVVTQSDKPTGRGQKTAAPPVKIFAEENGIPVFQPDRLRGNQPIVDILRNSMPDVIVVVAYGKILPPEVLSIPRFGSVNVHFSLLPKYRGAAPVQWAIINGEETTGVTIMKMNERMDEGDILDQHGVEILEDDDTLSVTNYLSCLGGEVLLSVLARTEETGVLEGVPQDQSQASYAPKLQKEDGVIDWSLSSEAILSRIRGLRPWPCAYTFLNGSQVKIHNAELPFIDERNIISSEIADKIPPGTVIECRPGRGFFVKTGNGVVLITELQPENRRSMSATDFINGKYISIGSRFE